jgi:hypothetical protein
MHETPGLVLDLSAELVPIGPGQLLDPRGQSGLVIVHGQGGQSIHHRVADGTDGHQLPEQDIDQGATGQGDRRPSLPELFGDLVSLASQHPGQAVLGHHQRRGRSGGQPGVEGEPEPGREVRVGPRAGPSGVPEPFEEGTSGQGSPAVGPLENGATPARWTVEPSLGPSPEDDLIHLCPQLPGTPVDVHEKHDRQCGRRVSQWHPERRRSHR